MGVKRPRSEYGATVVLAAEFCDQSMSTLFSRSVFFIAETMRSLWSASRLRASSWATSETCCELTAPSSGA